MAEGLLYGKALRDKHFLYKDGYVPLNHGSFGTFPRAVKDEMIRLLDQCEGNVDGYIRYTYPVELEKSRQIAADLLNVDSSTVVFLPNATTAINVVLRALTWRPEDVIMYLDIGK